MPDKREMDRDPEIDRISMNRARIRIELSNYGLGAGPAEYQDGRTHLNTSKRNEMNERTNPSVQK